jgi:nucleotide-binding universal stress UspA family protein
MAAAPPILSILVATDLSDNSVEAIRAAADLAIVTGARLHVIHAYEEPSVLSGGRDLLTVQRQVHSKRAELYDVIQQISGRRLDVASARVDSGPAAEVILKEARSVSADLIILGSHRHRGVADRLVGSTAEHVLRRTAVPCMVLNGPLSLPLRRILVPTDLAVAAPGVVSNALLWADVLCESADADITLAHVADPAVEVDGSYRFRPDLHEELRSIAQDAGRRAGWKIPIRTQLLQGEDAAREIADYASSIEAGLVVIGTQADPVIVRALLGSVTSALVREADLPLLLIPPAPRVRVAAPLPAAAPQRLAGSVAG